MKQGWKWNGSHDHASSNGQPLDKVAPSSRGVQELKSYRCLSFLFFSLGTVFLTVGWNDGFAICSDLGGGGGGGGGLQRCKGGGHKRHASDLMGTFPRSLGRRDLGFLFTVCFGCSLNWDLAGCTRASFRLLLQCPPTRSDNFREPSHFCSVFLLGFTGWIYPLFECLFFSRHFNAWDHRLVW